MPLMPANPRPKRLECTKCGCQWFENVRAVSYPPDVTFSPGLEPYVVEAYSFQRCLKCGQLCESNTYMMAFDNQNSPYHEVREVLLNPSKDK